MNRSSLVLTGLLLFTTTHCGDAGGPATADAAAVHDTAGPGDTAAIVDGDPPTDADAAALVDAVVDVAADAAGDADAAEACPPNRVPRVVGDVVVDPCGCCAIGGEYCHGLRQGGSPMAWGECPVVYDAVPPCTPGFDDNGCATLVCDGSCLDPRDFDTHEAPDAG